MVRVFQPKYTEFFVVIIVKVSPVQNLVVHKFFIVDRRFKFVIMNYLISIFVVIYTKVLYHKIMFPQLWP